MFNDIKFYEKNDYNKIIIYCFSSNILLEFNAFLTNFTDQVSPSWNNQVVYSRMDPLYTYKNTTRKISISFDVPSQDLKEAKNNYYKINDFLDSMYPLFSEGDNTSVSLAVGASIVNGPPLFRIKFSQYIEGNENFGLVGIIQNLQFSPEILNGFFIEKTDDKDTNVYPKLYKLNFVFDVLHEILDQPEGINDSGRYIKLSEQLRKDLSTEQITEEARKSEWERLPPYLQEALLQKEMNRIKQMLAPYEQSYKNLESSKSYDMDVYKKLVEQDKLNGTKNAQIWAEQNGLKIEEEKPEVKKDKSKSSGRSRNASSGSGSNTGKKVETAKKTETPATSKKK